MRPSQGLASSGVASPLLQLGSSFQKDATHSAIGFPKIKTIFSLNRFGKTLSLWQFSFFSFLFFGKILKVSFLTIHIAIQADNSRSTGD